MDNKTSLLSLKELVQLVSAPLIVCESSKIVFFNDSACELLGYDNDTVEKLSLFDLFDTSSRKSVEALAELAERNSDKIGITEYELVLRRKTGRKCEVSLSVSTCQIDGKKYLIFTLQDLTFIKKQEAERRRLLEETARISKLADIGRLTGGMAHELNNPLSILMGYLEHLSLSIRDGDLNQNSLLESIDPIENAAKRMSRIIKGMLAKIRDEKTQLKNQPLNQIVTESIILLKGVLASQSIELELKVDPDLWIQADTTSIEQIITNIVTNACNALDSKKERLISIRSKIEGSHVQLEVWNNGELIPEDVQKKLFTPFFTTKEVGEGTGLGLYMSYQIMKSHQGELSFYSSEKQGTAFILTFPLASAPRIDIPDHTIRALVVDDDTFFRRLLVKKLEKLNFSCKDVWSGEKAIELLKEDQKSHKHSYDVVFLDYKMPRMDGISFLTEIKRIGIQVPVILVSGDLSPQNAKAYCEKHLIMSYLSKPIDNSELRVLVESISQKVSKKKSA